eukprot:TRINITY_DN1258_c0_g1_i1.p1 TRINITY_DN1258_c0_g1~~TRINITY_DN1258_c0_g1_i1.p1  ORF type:complete len:282 (+),score=57.03 TRINITY_DN1258_c0_g1_i1:127-846(+)
MAALCALSVDSRVISLGSFSKDIRDAGESRAFIASGSYFTESLRKTFLAQAVRRLNAEPLRKATAYDEHATTLSLGGTRMAPGAVRAMAEDSSAATKKKFGLGGGGAWFGFGPRQELNVGRLAMVGFVSALVMEVLTGKGALGQLGIDALSVRGPFLAGFIFLLVGGLLGGYVVINNPPDISKAPLNAGAGIPRDPLKTFDPTNLDPLTTYTRGGVVTRSDGQKGREPYVSDLKEPESE